MHLFLCLKGFGRSEGAVAEHWTDISGVQYSARTHINMAAVQLRPPTRSGPLICVPSEHVRKGSRFAS